MQFEMNKKCIRILRAGTSNYLNLSITIIIYEVSLKSNETEHVAQELATL
jgi:hypothetical protein